MFARKGRERCARAKNEYGNQSIRSDGAEDCEWCLWYSNLFPEGLRTRIFRLWSSKGILGYFEPQRLKVSQHSGLL